MNNLLLHPVTKQQFQALAVSEPHAVLISGKSGAGKAALAQALAASLLGQALANHPYIWQRSGQEQTLGIDDIRDARQFLRRKTTGKQPIRRALLLFDVHNMTVEAQNALLKALEEPPADTVIILTASDPTALKQTIRSRTQQLNVLPVSLEQAKEYFKAAAGLENAFYLSDGLVGLMSALLEAKTDHPLLSQISAAKDLLQKSPHERLLLVDQLSKDKTALAGTLYGLERVVKSGLNQAAHKQQLAPTKRFYHFSQAIADAQAALAANSNAKLVLTRLMLDMV